MQSADGFVPESICKANSSYKDIKKFEKATDS